MSVIHLKYLHPKTFSKFSDFFLFVSEIIRIFANELPSIAMRGGALIRTQHRSKPVMVKLQRERLTRIYPNPERGKFKQ